MRAPMIALVAAAALTLGACQQGYGGYGPKQTGGAVLGAGAGALLGNQFGSGSGRIAATVAGGLLGAFLGGSVGASLDRNDQMYAERSAQSAFETYPSGRPAEWRNPDSGNYGTVVPQQAYQNQYGETCREYQQTIVVGGRTQNAYGTACRQPDGSWRIANS
ncbi:RT0821/Lpp0805 family surface protein [Zavarzinia sp. CC-PAN008]|uniref:RT0821/Lpp0805 family surface protein n=1 Tax=Zavarzinia sp. CC-PAN008 TaxID=3243332 RepID=UPI003F747A58